MESFALFSACRSDPDILIVHFDQNVVLLYSLVKLWKKLGFKEFAAAFIAGREGGKKEGRAAKDRKCLCFRILLENFVKTCKLATTKIATATIGRGGPQIGLTYISG